MKWLITFILVFVIVKIMGVTSSNFLLPSSSSSLSISIENDGDYTIYVDGIERFASGDTTIILGGVLKSARYGSLVIASNTTSSGTDGIGSYTQIQLVWDADTLKNAFVTSFRIYLDRPAIQFISMWPQGDLHVVPSSTLNTSSTFPSLVMINETDFGSAFQDPKSGNCGWTAVGAPGLVSSGALLVLTTPLSQDAATVRSSIGFAAATSISSMKQVTEPAYKNGPKALNSGPYPSLIIEPGFTSSMIMIVSSSSGFDPRASAAAALGFPPGGVNAALLALGDAIMDLHGKIRPTPEISGSIYTGLGYSTTGIYFYNPCDGGRFPNGTSPPGRSHMPGPNGDNCVTYADTLTAVMDNLSKSNIPPIHHLLLDSWWYGEGIYSGVSQWEDSSSLMNTVQSFPNSLKSFVDTLDPKIALWAHNGMFIPSSPYVTNPQYGFIGGVLPQGPALWDYLFPTNRNNWRLQQIKQDHVGQSIGVLGTITNTSTMDLWMSSMADAGTRANVSVQYCCSPPSILHAGAAFKAAIGARASPDYVAGSTGLRPLYQWAIGVESAFHWLGAGLLPDKDTTITNSSYSQKGGDALPKANQPSFYKYYEQNAVKHLLAATLSGGPTSFTDAVGAENITLIQSVCRADGIILRSSRTFTAIDAEFNSIIFGSWRGRRVNTTPETNFNVAKDDQSLPNGNLGEISSTVTIIGDFTFYLVTAAELASPFDLASTDLAISTESIPSFVAFSWDLNTFTPLPPSPAFNPTIQLITGHLYTDVPALVIISPRISSGSIEWILLGEIGKMIPLSPQRISAINTDSNGGLQVSLLGAGSEPVQFSACLVKNPKVEWNGCQIYSFSCQAPGTISFPSGTCE
jgi:hypothetical protein